MTRMERSSILSLVVSFRLRGDPVGRRADTTVMSHCGGTSSYQVTLAPHRHRRWRGLPARGEPTRRCQDAPVASAPLQVRPNSSEHPLLSSLLRSLALRGAAEGFGA